MTLNNMLKNCNIHSGHKISDPLLLHFIKLIAKLPGYSQIPNFLFALELSKHALLVFIYLIRCANRQKDNICFPSIKNICKNCSIPSETTVREAIKELINIGFVTKYTSGRKNIYKINNFVYLAIDISNGKELDVSKIEDILPQSDGIVNEKIKIAAMETPYKATPTELDGTQSPSDSKYHHHMLSNKTNRTRLMKKKNEKENYKKQPNGCDISFEKNFLFLTATSKYFYLLTESGKTSFDNSAEWLLRSGEPNPRNSITSQRIVRCRLYELLLGLEKWNQSMPKLIEGIPFYLTMETLKSKHNYVEVSLLPDVESQLAAV